MELLLEGFFRGFFHTTRLYIFLLNKYAIRDIQIIQSTLAFNEFEKFCSIIRIWHFRPMSIKIEWFALITVVLVFGEFELTFGTALRGLFSRFFLGHPKNTPVEFIRNAWHSDHSKCTRVQWIRVNMCYYKNLTFIPSEHQYWISGFP